MSQGTVLLRCPQPGVCSILYWNSPKKPLTVTSPNTHLGKCRAKREHNETQQATSNCFLPSAVPTVFTDAKLGKYFNSTSEKGAGRGPFGTPGECQSVLPDRCVSQTVSCCCSVTDSVTRTHAGHLRGEMVVEREDAFTENSGGTGGKPARDGEELEAFKSEQHRSRWREER